MRHNGPDENLREYYGRRAREYEAIYRRDDSVRRGEQVAIAAAMKEILRDRNVLEIACGTGFWTEVIATVARRVVAVDAAPEMLAVAREKGLSPETVELCEGDAYALDRIPGTFNAGVANFWLSHVPRARMQAFLRGFHGRLQANAVVFMADNVYVSGVGGALIRRPGHEDTFKVRRLADGSTHEVRKNYYDARFLHRLLGPFGCDLKVTEATCFWWVTYRIR